MAENNVKFYKAAQSVIDNRMINANEADSLALTSTENLQFHKDNKHILLWNCICWRNVLISESTDETESNFHSLDSDIKVSNWLTEEHKRVISSTR